MEENKLNYKTVIIRVALFLAMLATAIVSTWQSFNLLVTMDYGVDISSMYSMVKWMTPPLIAIIYYALYRIYAGLLRSTLNARMAQFNRTITINSLRELIDPCMIVLSIWVALVNVLFMFFPLYKNILLVILKELGAAGAIFWMYQRIQRGLEKLFRPIIFWAMQMPLIILVVLV